MMTVGEIKAIAFSRTVADYLIQDSFIEIAQEKHIRPVLGDTLYEDVVANPGDHAALLVYIKKALAWFVKFYALPSIYIDISTTGVKQVQTQGTSQATDDNLGTMQQQALTVANQHVNIMVKYLKDQDYALWIRPKSDDIEILGGIIFNKNIYEDNYIE